MEMTALAKQVVRELFALYLSRPQEMQGRFLARLQATRTEVDEASAAARDSARAVTGVRRVVDVLAGRRHLHSARHRFEHLPVADVHRHVAGMTDRFAAREHERLTGLKLL